MSLPPPQGVLHGLIQKSDSKGFSIARSHIIEACARMQEAGYEHLSCITAVDWKDRWEVLYHIAAFGTPTVIALRVELPYNDPTIPSIASLWKGAIWHERETYDLMGIKFAGNPDLRRILLPEDYHEFPLRKEVKFGNLS